MTLPKRKPAELAFYYKQRQRDSDIDLFVEGSDDKLLLDRFINDRNAKTCAVYTMESVDFSGFDFAALGLPAPSARSCVIALRKFLLDQGVNVAKHLFLVDRDTEDLCETPLINGIELTDSGALPVHLYDNAVERRFAELIYESKIDPRTLKTSVTSICTEIYLIRAASKLRGLGVRILPSADFIHGNSQAGFTLDHLGYLERCLHACGSIGRREEMITQIEECRAAITLANLRNYALINDHTLWEVLRTIGAKLGSSNNRSAQDIEELVRMTFDAEQLSGHRLFQAIAAHVGARIPAQG